VLSRLHLRPANRCPKCPTRPLAARICSACVCDITAWRRQAWPPPSCSSWPGASSTPPRTWMREQTYRGNGVSFDYPAGWEEGKPQTAADVGANRLRTPNLPSASWISCLLGPTG
jgi:hypothetical protein